MPIVAPQAPRQSPNAASPVSADGFLHTLQGKGYGPPEMASCGLDGCVRVWDVRQQDQPVASFEPLKGSQVICLLDDLYKFRTTQALFLCTHMCCKLSLP